MTDSPLADNFQCGRATTPYLRRPSAQFATVLVSESENLSVPRSIRQTMAVPIRSV